MSALALLFELKEKGVKNVILNVFTESLSYVIGLKLSSDEIVYDGVSKSYDGYSEIYNFTTTY